MALAGEVVSVNVGLPRTVRWKGRDVETGIFKSPVMGRVRIAGGNLEGDRQADLRHHGGEHKAVYAYPAEHYAFWREQYPGRDLPPGVFGENLTTRGLDESEVQIGDRFRVGTAVLEASEPRMPCSKLALRFEDDSVVERFLKSRRPGIYWRILDEGDVAPGDPVERVARTGNGLTVRDVADLYVGPSRDGPRLALALACGALSEKWRQTLRDRAGPA